MLAFTSGSPRVGWHELAFCSAVCARTDYASGEKLSIIYLKRGVRAGCKRGTVMIEYLLLKDLTDRPEDLSALAILLEISGACESYSV